MPTPFQLSAKSQAWIHLGLALAQIGVGIFLKDVEAKATAMSALGAAQVILGGGAQDKTPPKQ